ncbi:DUF6482 family protein [Motilimonas pumila]|uniref:Uncharacterized protein n=1 Tax=Motilimonas pumila TaxID=2303987 RepID=A0A418YJZ9_9GAMM|nr:DUF6482 family protein [Motilimonas pumila]RJG51285.1 hypothetical protein D1Z90_00685 [Motilimonas pumila]
MQSKQLKQWIRNGGEPECIIMTCSESSMYQPEIKVHDKFEPITDAQGNNMHFNSLVNTKNELKKIGFTKAVLELDVTSDEMLGEPIVAEDCFQRMEITL